MKYQHGLCLLIASIGLSCAGPEPVPKAEVQPLPEPAIKPSPVPIPTVDGVSLDRALARRFAVENALRRVGQVRTSLSGCTHESMEIQTIAYPNWTGAIEGTLHAQAYRIRELEYKLALYQFEAGHIDQKELDVAKEQFEQHREQFGAFVEAFHVVD
jgi:hypothetical protein